MKMGEDIRVLLVIAAGLATLMVGLLLFSYSATNGRGYKALNERRAEMVSIAADHRELIAAIEAYRAKNGAPPSRLDDLDEYRPSLVPWDYSYSQNLGGSGLWELRVFVSKGLMDTDPDALVYRSDCDYSRLRRGELLEKCIWWYHNP